jgi:hypothetical protein
VSGPGRTSIEELLARDAVREQLHAYCRAMDRVDHALGYSVWHEDGLADYGEIFNGSGREFVDWVCRSHQRLYAHSHQIATTGIVVAGERAASEAYVTAALRWRDDAGHWESVVRGRYLDRWSCRDGRWAIDVRRYVHDFDDVHPIGAERMQGWGRRDANDPSYAALTDLG